MTDHSSIIITPSPYAQALVDVLKPYAEVKPILPRRVLHFHFKGEQLCYLILDGRFAIHRQSDDRMMSIATTPC